MVRSSSVGVGVGDNSGVSFFPELKSSFSPSLNPFAEGSEYTGISLSADVPSDEPPVFPVSVEASSPGKSVLDEELSEPALSTASPSVKADNKNGCMAAAR